MSRGSTSRVALPGSDANLWAVGAELVHSLSRRSSEKGTVVHFGLGDTAEIGRRLDQCPCHATESILRDFQWIRLYRHSEAGVMEAMARYAV